MIFMTIDTNLAYSIITFWSKTCLTLVKLLRVVILSINFISAFLFSIHLIDTIYITFTKLISLTNLGTDLSISALNIFTNLTIMHDRFGVIRPQHVPFHLIICYLISSEFHTQIVFSVISLVLMEKSQCMHKFMSNIAWSKTPTYLHQLFSTISSDLRPAITSPVFVNFYIIKLLCNFLVSNFDNFY